MYPRLICLFVCVLHTYAHTTHTSLFCEPHVAHLSYTLCCFVGVGFIVVLFMVAMVTGVVMSIFYFQFWSMQDGRY